MAETAGTTVMAKTAKMAKMAKMAKTAKTAETAKTGLGRANSNNAVALLKNKCQGRTGSDFYNFFPKRQLNLPVRKSRAM